MNQIITWKEFEKVDIRVGEILKVEAFKEARKPAYKLEIDFGPDLGVKKSSSQITDNYSVEELVGKRVLAVINFAKKQIGPMMSECLVTGFYKEDGSVVLSVPDKDIPLGSKLL